MTTLLHIDTSILGSHSVSRGLSAAIVARLTANGGYKTIYRDLVAESPPHLTLATLPWDHPTSAKAGPLDETAATIRDESQRMLDEFLAADVVVIGLAMYNFTVPTQLKAWVDRIIVPGKTFRYVDNASVGLVGGKRVIVAVARGWSYAPQFGHGSEEHAETYMRTALGFVGIDIPEFVIAEGVALGDEAKAAAVAHARETIRRLAA